MCYIRIWEQLGVVRKGVNNIKVIMFSGIKPGCNIMHCYYFGHYNDVPVDLRAQYKITPLGEIHGHYEGI